MTPPGIGLETADLDVAAFEVTLWEEVGAEGIELCGNPCGFCNVITSCLISLELVVRIEEHILFVRYIADQILATFDTFC